MATKAEQYAYKTLNEIGWDLRAAYNWAAAMPYYRMSPDVVPAGVDPTQWYAEFGFENHTGNCYVMASTFYYMARLLGYDVHRVNGYVPISATEYNPHGWYFNSRPPHGGRQQFFTKSPRTFYHIYSTFPIKSPISPISPSLSLPRCHFFISISGANPSGFSVHFTFALEN